MPLTLIIIILIIIDGVDVIVWFKYSQKRLYKISFT